MTLISDASVTNNHNQYIIGTFVYIKPRGNCNWGGSQISFEVLGGHPSRFLTIHPWLPDKNLETL